MTEFGNAVAIVMLVGAARADAGKVGCLERLRATEPELRAAIDVGDYARAERVIRAAMPAGWEPREEWRLGP